MQLECKMSEEKYVYDVKIRSKVQPNIYHTIQVDLFCYEKIETGQLKLKNKTMKGKNVNSKLRNNMKKTKRIKNMIKYDKKIRISKGI